MENGKWRMENGEWKMENGKYSWGGGASRAVSDWDEGRPRPGKESRPRAVSDWDEGRPRPVNSSSSNSSRGHFEILPIYPDIAPNLSSCQFVNMTPLEAGSLPGASFASDHSNPRQDRRPPACVKNQAKRTKEQKRPRICESALASERCKNRRAVHIALPSPIQTRQLPLQLR